MLRIYRLQRFWPALLLVLGGVIFLNGIPATEEQQPRPAVKLEISPAQFSTYLQDWSEQEGFFDTDNFISNETSYLHVVNELSTRAPAGGAYIGVGPDQNFSYIAHTRPAIAVIIDIRRQNMLQHLFYKALFDMATNRAEYLSLLFSREVPQIRRDAPLPELLAAVRSTKTSEEVWRRNLAAVHEWLGKKYELKLTAQDLAKIDYVYRTFRSENLDLRFSSLGRNNASRYPTFEELLLETDREGRRRGYLSSEEHFQWLKKFQAENRLLPITGDFAGAHAFARVAAFLKEKGILVSAFYTSNVEYYLFGRSGWRQYMSNLKALPIDNASVIIRAYFSTFGRHPLSMPGHRSTTLVHGMKHFVEDSDAGKILDYWDVVNR
jgi:hypothetical protein